MKKCISELDPEILHNYSTENAAHDLAYAIDATKKEGDKVSTEWPF